MEWFKLYVLGAVSLLSLVGVIAYSTYRADLLRLQEPIVQTCVQHRVSQKVFVQQ
jgi:hypothetical protein